MKNIILSTAIAAICAAPAAAIAADNNLYGQLRYSFNSIDDKDGTGLDGLSGQDNVSLFGLKGTAGDGDTKAFYHLQTGAPSDKNASGAAFNQRFYFAGLKGGWGKAAYGRMTNAYKFDGFKLDPFYNLSHVNATGVYANGGASYGLSPATNGFTDNSLQYHSPAFSGITVNAGVYVDDTNEDNNSTGIGATWKGKGAHVGLQYIQNTNDTVAATQVIPGVYKDGSAMRVHGGFKAKSWSAGLSYEQVDEAQDASTNYMYLVGRFNATPKTELVLTVGTVDPDPGAANAAAEGTGYQLGVFQTVVSKTQLYVTYGAADLDAANYSDPSVISVGAIHKFGFGG
jgi:hypothetical protein